MFFGSGSQIKQMYVCIFVYAILTQTYICIFVHAKGLIHTYLYSYMQAAVCVGENKTNLRVYSCMQYRLTHISVHWYMQKDLYIHIYMHICRQQCAWVRLNHMYMDIFVYAILTHTYTCIFVHAKRLNIHICIRKCRQQCAGVGMNHMYMGIFVYAI